MFGRRSDLLREAKRRISASPRHMCNDIYGENEAGGTSWLYLSPVPFEQLGFPMHTGTRPYPEYTEMALGSVPLVLSGGGVLPGRAVPAVEAQAGARAQARRKAQPARRSCGANPAQQVAANERTWLLPATGADHAQRGRSCWR